jgi:hypothetical protein
MTTRPGYVWDATASEWVEIGQAAVVSPFKYQTSQPSSPATGDIWIDSDDEVPSVDSTLYYRWTKTMSGGETSLSGTDNNSLALKYTPGYESVFINGVLQVRGSDYVATTGTTVTGLTALTASDVVMVESIIAYSVGDTYTQTTLDGKFSPITTTGLVLLSTTTIGTAVSSVVVSNAFSANYNNYLIQINDSVASTDNEIRLKLGASTTGYNYSSFFLRYSGTTVNVLGNNTTSFVCGGGLTGGVNISTTLINPFLAKYTFMQSTYTFTDGSSAISGHHSPTTSYTDFTITTTTGTITGGTIKVYGYK